MPTILPPQRRYTANSLWPLLASAIVVCALGVFALEANAAERAPVKSLIELRRENVIVQEFDISCGAAALATLLKYQHGEDITERAVATGLIEREEYIANPLLVRVRQGFSLLDLKRYAETKGYEGIGYGQLTLDDLIERAPIIVAINTFGYNHFVIFRGIARGRVLLADPAWGNRTMTVEKFKRMWIDFPGLGHVGFIVPPKEGKAASNLLAPDARHFLIFQ